LSLLKLSLPATTTVPAPPKTPAAVSGVPAGLPVTSGGECMPRVHHSRNSTETQRRSSCPHWPAHGAEPLLPGAVPLVPQPFWPQPPLTPLIGTAGAAAAGAAGAAGAGAGGACVMYIPRAGVLARGTGMLGISGGMSDASSLPRRSRVLAVG